MIGLTASAVEIGLPNVRNDVTRSGPPSDAQQLCEMLLAMKPPAEGGKRTGEARGIFSTFGLALSNFSNGTIGRDWNYGALTSLEGARALVADRRRRDKTSRADGSDGASFIRLMEDAGRTREDYAVADFLKNLYELNSELSSQVFYLQALERAEVDLDKTFVEVFVAGKVYDFDIGMTELRRAWERLSTSAQKSSLDWIGQMLDTGVKRFHTTEIKFQDNRAKTVETFQSLPDLTLSEEQYLELHRGEAPVQILTIQFRKLLAGKFLRLYGLDVTLPRVAAEPQVLLEAPKARLTGMRAFLPWLK